jgi:hypothetical protein
MPIEIWFVQHLNLQGAKWSFIRAWVSKPSYPYNTIMTFWINYTHYNTIITLLLHLWHLQKSDHYNTLWQKPGTDHYYTYDMTIMIAIMTFWIYYDTYVYYNSIISIMTFRTIMTLITLRELLWHIMTKGKHYVHYIHYNTILSIITFRTFITLMTLRHYYTLLWQLQNIMRISTHVILAIIHIMVIKYFRSYRLTKAEYCVGFWF